jgi:MipA family protein
VNCSLLSCSPVGLLRDRRVSLARIVAGWMMVAASAAQAQAPAPPTVSTPPLPLWELGVFAVTASQQAYPGASQQTSRSIVLPFGVYRGQFLRADRGTFGVRAVKTPEFEIDVGFGGSLGSDSDRIEVRRGMPDLGTLVEAGPRLKWNLNGDDGAGRLRAEFPLRGVFDLSDGFRYKGLSFEPELTYEARASQGWRWSAGAGLVAGNRRLTDVLYGVAPQFATPERAAFDARAGLIAWRVSGTVSYLITPDLRLIGFARADTVAGAANRASPLVQQRTGVSGGIALSYTLFRSSSPAVD